MHFSSQCLNQGVKIFLGFCFFLLLLYSLYALSKAKKKSSSETALGDIGLWLCVHKPISLAVRLLQLHVCLCWIVWVYFFREEVISLPVWIHFPQQAQFPLFPGLKVCGCGKGHKCPQKAPPRAGKCWDTLN